MTYSLPQIIRCTPQKCRNCDGDCKAAAWRQCPECGKVTMDDECFSCGADTIVYYNDKEE